MNIIFSCGGTGGHINPAIAIANVCKERYPDGNILFIGGEGGMEETLVPKAGFSIKTLPADGASREKTLKALVYNAKVALKVIGSVRACKRIIREFKPDVVVGTGGYASFPALMAASMMKIPTCVHESNAMPGLTTRLVADRVDKVLVCFPESARHYRHPERIEVVGMPVNREFVYTRKEDARKELGLDQRPLIVSTFGSQGAKMMNEMTAKMFCLEQDAGFPYQHCHAVGQYGWSWFGDYAAAQGVNIEDCPSLNVQEYIYNMPKVMAAADIVISRAGASSCNEIAASGTPCILIPSPNVTDNHQEKNARALEDKGGAIVILEHECTAERVMEEIDALLKDREKYQAMSRALLNMVVPDCAERVCDIMQSLVSGK